jgi:hypothetical protein
MASPPSQPSQEAIAQYSKVYGYDDLRLGVHILEGPDYRTIGVINLCMLIMSGLTAYLWKYFTGDFQGAFGLAGWIVTVVNGVSFAYLARWRQE